MQNKREEPAIYLKHAEPLPSSGKKSDMTIAEQIQRYVNQLPPERQTEVLDFVAFLQKQVATSQPAKQHTLREHPAFGSWRNRKIDALAYEQAVLRNIHKTTHR
jgi:hypothetical protein